MGDPCRLCPHPNECAFLRCDCKCHVPAAVHDELTSLRTSLTELKAKVLRMEFDSADAQNLATRLGREMGRAEARSRIVELELQLESALDAHIELITGPLRGEEERAEKAEAKIAKLMEKLRDHGCLCPEHHPNGLDGCCEGCGLANISSEK